MNQHKQLPVRRFRSWRCFVEFMHDGIEQEFGTGFVYRGMASAQWSIQSSLSRAWLDANDPERIKNTDKGSSDIGLEVLEARVLASLNKDLQREGGFENWDSFDDARKLVFAQHFGVPTRLVDATHDWRIAAFFGAVDSFGKGLASDWAMWLFRKSASVSCLRRLRQAKEDLPPCDKQLIERILSHEYLVITDDPLEDGLVVYEPEVGCLQRIQAQRGCFVLQSCILRDFHDTLENDLDQRRTEWSSKKFHLDNPLEWNLVAPVVKFEFAAGTRVEAKRWLGKNDVSDRVLFPEGNASAFRVATRMAWQPKSFWSDQG